MSSYSRQQLEDWLKIIEVSGKVLDIGNSQQDIRKRVKEFKPDEYLGLDLEWPHEGKKSDIVYDINYEIKSTDEISKKYKEYFDQIFMLEVSEYLFDPLTAFRNVNQLLKLNSIFWLSVHFIYPIHEPYENDYLRYTRFGIGKLLRESGFDIEYIRPRISKNGILESFYLEEKMRPSKKYKGQHNEIGYLIKTIKKIKY